MTYSQSVFTAYLTYFPCCMLRLCHLLRSVTLSQMELNPKQMHMKQPQRALVAMSVFHYTRVIQKFPDWVNNEIYAYNTRWEATQVVVAAKVTGMTHKIAIQLHFVVESCTICSSGSRWPVRKLLDTPSYTTFRTPEVRTKFSWLGFHYQKEIIKMIANFDQWR
jgi:hypothetical protein